MAYYVQKSETTTSLSLCMHPQRDGHSERTELLIELNFSYYLTVTTA